MQDVAHVGGQGGQQGVEGPVGAHLCEDDGPQGDRQHHGQEGQSPAVTCTLQPHVELEQSSNQKII